MFDSDVFRVRQKSMTLGQKYLVEESDEVILESRDEKPDLGEGLVFFDKDGNKVLEIKEEQHLDVPASFTVFDRENEVIGGFERKWGFLSHDWQVISPENCVLGIIKQKRRLRSLLKRFVSDLFTLSFELMNKEGKNIGKIKGRFTVLEDYRIEIDRDEMNPRLGVAAAALIDIEESS